MVYYLAAHQRPLARETLLALFWPDAERAAAQQTLRAVLHALRTAIGPSLVTEKETLSLATDAEVDVRLFESQLSVATADPALLSSALELYRGDFLDGFSLPDSPEFDEWVAGQRERYRRLMLRGLTALAGQHEQNGALAEALAALDRALAFDPLQEDVQRTCIRLHYMLGDRAGAIRRYDTLVKLLDEEMGVPPMSETRSLYDAVITDTLDTTARPQSANSRPRSIGTRSSHSRPSASTALPFTGRELQMAALRASQQDDARRLLLIEGEPGIGKTRLAEEFIAASGAIALAGATHELEKGLPYQPIIDALRDLVTCPEWSTLAVRVQSSLSPVWRAEIARLLPELVGPIFDRQPTPATADEWRLWESVNQLILVLATQHPIVLFVDDLQWADSSTLGMLGYLIRHSAGAPISLLAATRPFSSRSPLASLVQALTREDRLHRLVLTRLEHNDVVAIARGLSTTFAYPLAEWLQRNSEGIPYILAELVREARGAGMLSPEGTVNLQSLSSSPVVPGAVYSLIQSRLDRLSEAARRVLDAAVTIGREFGFELASRAAGISESAALDALDELIDAGLIRSLGGVLFAFDHSLTMEVAYREAGEPRHRMLHRRVAETLESMSHGHLETVAGLLAWHFGEGNAPQRAALYALQAGQQAARLAAWTEAIAFYEQALAGTKGTQRLTALTSLGQVLIRAGQAVRSSETLRQALTLAESLGDVRAIDTVRLSLVESYLPQARYAEAMALAEQVRDTGLPESAMQAELLWGTASSLEGTDLGEAARHLLAADALCEKIAPNDLVSLAHIRFERGSVAAQEGNLSAAVALYRESLTAGQHAGNREAALPHLVLAHNNLAYHLHLLDDPAAWSYAMEGLRLAQENGLLGLQPYLLSTVGEIALGQGDLGTAENRFSQGLAIAEQLSIPERIAGLTANLGLVAQQRGETATAIHRLSSALARADALRISHLAAQIRIWLAPLLPPHEARSVLAQARAIAERGQRRLLLEEVERLESQLQHA